MPRTVRTTTLKQREQRRDEEILKKRQETAKQNREKGEKFEQEVWNVLKKYNQTIRHMIGFWNKEKEEYVPIGDGGIDLHTTINGYTIMVQAKNLEKRVGLDTVRSLIGSLEKYHGLYKIGLLVANKKTVEEAYGEMAIKMAEQTIEPPIYLTTLELLDETIKEISSKHDIKEIVFETIKIKKASKVHIKGKRQEIIIENGENIELFENKRK
jgi:hypothetical protein